MHLLIVSGPGRGSGVAEQWNTLRLELEGLAEHMNARTAR